MPAKKPQKPISKKTNSKPANDRVSYFKKEAPKDHKEKVAGGVFVYSQPQSVSQLAQAMNLAAVDIIKFLFMQNKMVTINSTLDDELIGLVCLQFGYDFKKEVIVAADDFEKLTEEDDADDLVKRPAIVTIMGHVDHGKTTLLDRIRRTRVAEGEAGGITQHIGAYQIELRGEKITFLDTPGHAAFSAMRARGSQVTDIVILVVAADDGVMPQTREAIDHAKAAKVPMIVAINKIDKPGADSERIKMALADLDVMPEEWGGQTIFREVSAKTGQGLDELLEAILLVAEVNELTANPSRYAKGTVIEARLEKGRGPVATLLVSNGTLRVGDALVIGSTFGKVRQMLNDRGQVVKSAGPSTPVELIGIDDVPQAGDQFMAFADERQAREIAAKRAIQKQLDDRKGTSALSLDDMTKKIQDGEVQTLNILLKTDVQGSAEAIKGMLDKIHMDGVSVHVIRAQAGGITESDVILAQASQAIIYGFNVRPDAVVRDAAAVAKVEIRLHRIIYHMMEEIEAALKGMLKPVFQEVVLGQAEVRQLFKVSKVGTIAGAMVTSGLIQKSEPIRLIRDGVVVYEGKLASLKRFQDDVAEVKLGYDCGFMIENFNDLRERDIVECYKQQEVERT